MDECRYCLQLTNRPFRYGRRRSTFCSPEHVVALALAGGAVNVPKFMSDYGTDDRELAIELWLSDVTDFGIQRNYWIREYA